MTLQQQKYTRLPLGGGDRKNETAVRPLIAIAVARDDDRNRLTQILGALNARVIAHDNLRTLRRSLLRDDVDLVITDVTLADANWADILRLIVRASLATGILVHCSGANETLRSEAMWRGADGMLIAPYSVEDVSEVVQKALPGVPAAADEPDQTDAERFPKAFSAGYQEVASARSA
jgi:DNA-binding NtrC family response regulator